MQSLISDFFTKKIFSFIQTACTPASAQKRNTAEPSGILCEPAQQVLFFYSMLSFQD
jgi:hypothetical protein